MKRMIIAFLSLVLLSPPCVFAQEHKDDYSEYRDKGPQEIWNEFLTFSPQASDLMKIAISKPPYSDWALGQLAKAEQEIEIQDVYYFHYELFALRTRNGSIDGDTKKAIENLLNIILSKTDHKFLALIYFLEPLENKDVSLYDRIMGLLKQEQVSSGVIVQLARKLSSEKAIRDLFLIFIQQNPTQDELIMLTESDVHYIFKAQVADYLFDNYTIDRRVAMMISNYSMDPDKVVFAESFRQSFYSLYSSSGASYFGGGILTEEELAVRNKYENIQHFMRDRK